MILIQNADYVIQNATKVLRNADVLIDGARIKAMLQYVQAHYMEELHVEQIAASALIGEGECLRCFRGTIGTTPMQYVKQFRIQKAQFQEVAFYHCLSFHRLHFTGCR